MTIQDIISEKNEKVIEALLIGIMHRIHDEGPVNPRDFERLAYIKKFHGDLFSRYENKLMYLMGLFYKTTEPQNLLEEIYSQYGDLIADEIGKKATPVQASAYQNIYAKKYFSFSAPTSSGKSFLFRELIQRVEGDMVIVVPSRALIAEYMKAVTMVVDKSVLVLQSIENINIAKTKRRIYIITPERGVDLFKNIDDLNIELFLFDEAQISDEEIRGMRFDSFVRRVSVHVPLAKKVFAHPFIQNPEAQLKKHNFFEDSGAMRYDQQSVGKIYLSVNNGKFFYFSPYREKKTDKKEADGDVTEKILQEGGTLLIYASKANIYDGSHIEKFSKYTNMCPKLTDPKAIKIIDALRVFIGASDEKRSFMINMMERGIVVHHGSMPLKARILIENFINGKFARICFATSTLSQGVNMPFDIVWIHNFSFNGDTNKKNLDLKNLIGRAGRSTGDANSFDFGYVIVENKNVDLFCTRIGEPCSLSEKSELDNDLTAIAEDLRDISEAIKENSFDDQLQLTNEQVKRLRESNINEDIGLILDVFLTENKPFSAETYYSLSDANRNRIKLAFKNIFVAHLRRRDLKVGEAVILSASIPILLWQIQGRSFKEIVSLRYAFLSEKRKRREILASMKVQEISPAEAKDQIDAIEIRYSPAASPLPNALRENALRLFPRGSRVSELDYDILVYDTYDFIDKVISLSLTDPLTAAFQLYFNTTGDDRALVMKNYIRYGTNDATEIWLIRYGFGFDDIEWIKEHVQSIDENGISFLSSIGGLDADRYEIIERFA